MLILIANFLIKEFRIIFNKVCNKKIVKIYTFGHFSSSFFS
jgi:hypothetical protein